MRKQLLKLIVRLVVKAPLVVLFTVLVLVIISLFGIFRLTIETNVTKLLPSDSKVVTTYQQALKHFGAFDYMLVVLEAKEPHSEELLIDSAEIVASTIDNPHYIYSIDYKVDPEVRDFYLYRADERFVSLLTDEDWKAITDRFQPEEIARQLKRLRRKLVTNIAPAKKQELLADPLNFAPIVQRRLVHSRGPAKLELRRGYFISKYGRMLLMVVKPLKSSSDLLFTTQFMDFLKQSRKAIYKRHPQLKEAVNIDFVGSHVEAMENAQLVRQDLLATLIASFLLVLTLFILTFKRFDAIYLIGAPLMVGIMWSLGLTGFLFGRLTLLTFAFGAVLIGLGIDFAIHIYNRFVEEIEQGEEIEFALETAILATGEGIITGAVTTAVAFYCMWFTSFEGFKELGIVAGNGILSCLAAIYLVLAPMLILKARYYPSSLRKAKVSSLGLKWISRNLLNYPRMVTMLAIMITAYFGVFALRVRFNEKLEELKQTSVEYDELTDRIRELFALPSDQLIAIVSGRTIEEALEKNDLLYDKIEKGKGEYKILSCDSLRTSLPSAKTQRESHQRILSLNIEELSETIKEQAQAVGLDPASLQPFIERLKGLQQNAQQDKIIKYDSLRSPIFIRLVQRYMRHAGRKYRIVTHIYPEQGLWRYQVPRDFMRYLQKDIGPIEFTGATILANELEGTIKYDLALVVILVLLSVVLILLLHFKELLLVLLAMIPVIIGTIWMLGTISILGIEMNFLNIMVVPMIVGIGVDDGIHLIQRLREKERGSLQYAIERTGRAVVITSFTTGLAFGSLSLANFRGISEMGLISILGVGYCLIVSITVLTSVLKVWEQRYRLADFIAVEKGEIH